MNKDDKNRHFVLLIIDISKHGAKEMGHLKMAGPGFVNDVTAGSGHYSDSLLLRRPIIPTAHCSDSPFLRQPIIPSKMVKSSIIILKSVVFLLYLTKD